MFNIYMFNVGKLPIISVYICLYLYNPYILHNMFNISVDAPYIFVYSTFIRYTAQHISA